MTKNFNNKSLIQKINQKVKIMAFDRSKFTAPKLETNKKVSDDVNKTMRVNNSNRGDYLTIDEGVNVFRLFPPHNPDEPTFQPKVVYWLDCRVPKQDAEGNPIEGEFEWKRRPIFDSRIHGNTQKDIIDEYIKFTRNAIFTNNSSEDAKKLVAAINGWRDKSGKWNPGILPSTSFVAYATKGDITIANLGRLELFQSDKDELEKLNVDEKSGEIITTDIWSGPDDGIQFVLTRRKNDKGKWEHTIQKKTFVPKDKKNIAKEWEEFIQSQVIPDDVLEHWSKMEPLSVQFKNAYKRSDFERAVEALQKFDADHSFHTFENDEFLEILKEIDSYYPDEEPEAEQEDTVTNAAVIDYSEMSREELKRVIAENGLGIKVFKSTSTEDLAKRVEEAMKAKEEPEEEEEEGGELPEAPSAPYNAANARPGVGGAKDSASAAAGEREEEKLPWEKEEQAEPEAPADDPAVKAAALRKKLAGLSKK